MRKAMVHDIRHQENGDLGAVNVRLHHVRNVQEWAMRLLFRF